MLFPIRKGCVGWNLLEQPYDRREKKVDSYSADIKHK